MRNNLLALAITALLAGCNTSSNDSSAPAVADQAYEYLVQLSSSTEGIGARPTGSQAETRTAAWIQDNLTGWGYEVENAPFTYTKNTVTKAAQDLASKNTVTLHSQNLIAELKGQSDKVILIGAHYDSTGENKGSEGATDNGAGVAALLAVAEALKGQTLPYTVRFAFFGAEENGLNGSKAYAASLDQSDIDQLLAMVNYDTIAGGDTVYVHSALSDASAYNCADPSRYSADPAVRDRLLAISQQTATPFAIHPSYDGYPQGETGSWSDHAPFACLGVPIAYVEATNFTINGEDGYDGYSQTTNPALWDCYDPATKSACDRDSETQWGKIWHTQYDRLDKMAELFPGRVQQQLGANTELMIRFLKAPGL